MQNTYSFKTRHIGFLGWYLKPISPFLKSFNIKRCQNEKFETDDKKTIRRGQSAISQNISAGAEHTQDRAKYGGISDAKPEYAMVFDGGEDKESLH